MKGRKASVYITYNGKTIKTALDNFQNSFSYTDPDGGERDSIKISGLRHGYRQQVTK